MSSTRLAPTTAIDLRDEVDELVTHRWRGRPWLARGVRLLVVLVPVAVAIVATSVVSRWLPTPRTTAATVSWWILILAVSLAALVASDRFMRRFVPLALLLKLALPFPEAAPSRLRIAIKSGSPKQLRRWVDSVAARGRHDPNAIAAHELLALVTALHSHDRRSRGHAERVRVYGDLMAEQLGLSPDDADRLRWASLLHDIGKLEVPAAILNKTGAPDASEWETIERHPQDGDRLIEPVRDWLGPWSRAVVEHHEHWDGSGYPRGLAGHDISLAGRIVAVIDSYEVMTATRSYKRPMSVNAARAELAKSSGSQFDPAMVRAFLLIPIGRMRWYAGPVAFFGQLPFLGQIPSWGATAMVATTVAAAAPVIIGETLPLAETPAAASTATASTTEQPVSYSTVSLPGSAPSSPGTVVVVTTPDEPPPPSGPPPSGAPPESAAPAPAGSLTSATSAEPAGDSGAPGRRAHGAPRRVPTLPPQASDRAVERSAVGGK